MKTPCIKNSEYESQTKKMIPIVISTISHFLSPTLTTFWQSVFVSFSPWFILPSTQIFFLWGLIFVVVVVGFFFAFVSCIL